MLQLYGAFDNIPPRLSILILLNQLLLWRQAHFQRWCMTGGVGTWIGGSAGRSKEKVTSPIIKFWSVNINITVSLIGGFPTTIVPTFHDGIRLPGYCQRGIRLGRITGNDRTVSQGGTGRYWSGSWYSWVSLHNFSSDRLIGAMYYIKRGQSID